MKEGIDYAGYIREVTKKVQAWDTVSRCFTLRQEVFADEVHIYFEALEAVFDAAFPDKSPSEVTIETEPVAESDCVKNLEIQAEWYEVQAARHTFGIYAGLRREKDRRIAKDIRRVLKHKFGAEAPIGKRRVNEEHNKVFQREYE